MDDKYCEYAMIRGQLGHLMVQKDKKQQLNAKYRT